MRILNGIHHTEDYLFAAPVYLLCLSVTPQQEWYVQWQDNDPWVIVKQMGSLHTEKKATIEGTTPKHLQYKPGWICLP